MEVVGMTNRPIQKYRIGNWEAAVWENIREKNGVELNFKTVSLSRSYKKKDEDLWRSEVLNMRRMDIQKIRAILDKVEHYLFFEVNDKDRKEEED
jgi:hypothetical protein